MAFLLLWPMNLWAFDGDRAFKDIETQLSFGPRHLSAKGHAQVQGWITTQAKAMGDQYLVQSWTQPDGDGGDYRLKNILVRFNPKASVRILIGAHYDSRSISDRDPKYPHKPLIGANDSASGTAVLMELARQLKKQPFEHLGVDLLFFDGEEGEEDQHIEWYPVGSYAFVQDIRRFYPNDNPDLAIVVDMVCDKDLQLYYEEHSFAAARWAVEEIWTLGAKQHPGFIPKLGYRIFDDHTSLMRAGIPSLLLIDFDYPAFHTQGDDLSQCSSKSLEAVGVTIWKFIEIQEKRLSEAVIGSVPK